MTPLQVSLVFLSVGFVGIIILAATGAWCRIFGHNWKRTSAWRRDYQCRTCLEYRR